MKEPPQDPPCGQCRVIAFEENEDALNIFFTTMYQLIMGSNGPVGINQLAVHEAMRLYKIKARRQCFEKVMMLSGWWIGKIMEKHES